MIDKAYEIFGNLSREEQNKYIKLCDCKNCLDKDDEGGLYAHCAHFSTCASDIILKQLENQNSSP